MIKRTLCVLPLALAACGDKKSTSGSPGGSAARPPAAADAAAVAVPPPRPLPPLVADPGGATGEVLSVVSFGGPKTDSTRAIAVAPDGGVLVAGYFEDAAKFGALTQTVVGKSDAYVARLDGQGGFAWVRTLGSVNEDTADALAVGPDGSMAVGGLFSAELKVGALTATAAGSDDLYVAMLSPTGEPRWLWTTGGEGSDAVTALVATPDGGVVAAVSWHDVMKIGDVEYTAKAYDDAALVKLDREGGIAWVTPMSGEGSEVVRRLAVDANGMIYALGSFQQTIDVGGGPLTSAGAMDVLIASFDPAGRHRWSRHFGNPWNEVGGGIVVDRAGNVLITGSFDRELDLFGTKLTSQGESDVLVARLDTDGKLVWAKRFGNSREDIGYGIAADDAGNAIVVGWFETPIDFGGGPLPARGQKDGFVVKLSVDGKHVWSRGFGDWDNDSGNAVTVAADGSVWLTGIFRYGLHLGDKTVTSTQLAGAKVQLADSFAAHLAR